MELASIGEVLVAIGLLGAGTQDAWESKVYDFWWLPILAGSSVVFALSDPGTLALRVAVFAALAVGVARDADKGSPLADGFGTLTLILATGDWFILALAVALITFYLTRLLTLKKKVPWIPFVLLGWAVTLVV